MNRIYVTLFLFVALMATPVAAQVTRSQHILRTDTILRSDTIITTEVVKRTEIINRIEEVIQVDTVYGNQANLGNEAMIGEKAKIGNEGIIGEKANPSGLTSPALPIHAEGGKYIWVPDSMAGDVGTLLQGHSKLVDSMDRIDSNEKVLFRGDTIPMVLRSRNLGRFSRGLFNYLYIPKGIWQLGITASYGEFSTEDLEMLDFISDMDFQGKMFSIKPYFSYFFNNNMSAGLRLGYSYGRANIDRFAVDIDDDMNFDLHDVMYRSESFSAALTFNQYFGITRRGRFGVFNEVELAFSGGNSDFIRPYNSELKHTHTTSMEASLNFSPGVSVYIIEPVTFNISFGVFGFYLKNEKQTVDGEEMGNRFTSGANFRFNIFNINFGVAVNL